MEKEEILEQSRKINKNKDLFEQEVIAKGSSIAYSIGILIAVIFYLIGIIFQDNYRNYPVFAVWTSMESVLFIFKFIKLKRKHELLVAVIFTIGAIMAIIMSVLQIIGIME